MEVLTINQSNQPGQGLKEGDQSLGHIGVEMLEEAGHVGQGRKAVGVEVAVPHLQHVVLDGPGEERFCQ